MSDLIYQYFSEFYDLVQDPVCVFDDEGYVSYCNEIFSTLTGSSQVRLLNRKTTVFNSFKAIDNRNFDLAFVQELVQLSGVSILKFETRKVLRGLGQFSIRKCQAQGYEHLYILTFKDLTIEEDLVKTFRFEINARNKKLMEMNQLVEIFQKIRLLEEPEPILNEFMSYLLSSSQVLAAGLYINKKMQFTFKDKSCTEVELSAIRDDISQHLSTNVISKYVTHKSSRKSHLNENIYYVIVPFKIASESMNVVFAFDSFDQLNKFSHQSAIILSEQLLLIINNLTLKELSYTDGLTKLKNNLYFRKRLEEVCSSQQNSQLVLFDVDFFKKINDTYGHPGGDAVLMFIGETIPMVMQRINPDFAQSTIARVGGEEFAILIPEKELEFAEKFAEELRAEIEKSKVIFNDIDIKFTISLGVASFALLNVTGPESSKHFYKAADDALYNSKRTGRNRVTSVSTKAAS